MSDLKQYPSNTMVALAGRRIDAPDAKEPRFPLKNVNEVRRRIAEALKDLQAVGLVCSAACGADLIALAAAEQLGVRRRIVLPFAPPRFRETSVVDRPGDWGAVFDHQIATTSASGDLVVLDLKEDNDRAYTTTNEAIIREAQKLVETPARLVAILVWEGSKQHGSDATAGFGDLAKKAEFTQRSILTL
jgi:hypothetical protein